MWLRFAHRRGKAAIPYLLLTPALTVLFIFLIFPIVWNAYLSVHSVTATNILKVWPYVGLENFTNLFSELNFYRSLQVSLIFVAGSVAGQLLTGLALALVLNRQLRGTNIFRVVLTTPWILSAVIAGFSWKWLYHENFGLLNYAIERLGLQPLGWLSDPNIAVWSLVLVNIWYGSAFSMLFQGAALTSISPDLYESASIDGAPPWKTFRYVILPLLRPFVAINLILITMWSVNFFDLLLVMTGGGPLFSTTTASLYMYRQAFEFGNFSQGATVGFMLVFINMAAAYAYVKIIRI